MSCHSRSIAINAAIVIDNEIFFNILCHKVGHTRISVLIFKSNHLFVVFLFST